MLFPFPNFYQIPPKSLPTQLHVLYVCISVCLSISVSLSLSKTKEKHKTQTTKHQWDKLYQSKSTKGIIEFIQVGRLFLGTGLALECDRYTQFHYTIQTDFPFWASTNQKQLTGSSWTWSSLPFLSAGSMSGMNLCLMYPVTASVSLYFISQAVSMS